MRRVSILIFLLIIGRSADFLTTYYFTPDLSHEGNFLVSRLGLGWLQMAALNIMATLAISIGLIHFWRHPPRLPYDPKIRTAWNLFFHYEIKAYLPRAKSTYHNQNNEVHSKNWRHSAYSSVEILAPTLILASSYVVLSWFLLHHFQWQQFKILYKTIYPLSVLGPFICALAYSSSIFYRREFDRYQRQHSSRLGLIN